MADTEAATGSSPAGDVRAPAGRTAPHRTSRRGRAVWWSGVALLAGAALIDWNAGAADWPSQPLLLFSRLVIQGGTFLLAAFGLGVVLVFLSAARWLWSWSDPGAGTTPSPGSGDRVRPSRWRTAWTVVRRIAVIATSTTLVLASIPLAGLLWLASSRYHVLAPTGPGGCRVVVEQVRGAMWDSYGRIYLADPGTIRLRDSGDEWSGEGGVGYDPIDAGTWSLRWDGAVAELDIWGQHDGQPVGLSRRTAIVCPVN